VFLRFFPTIPEAVAGRESRKAGPVPMPALGYSVEGPGDTIFPGPGCRGRIVLSALRAASFQSGAIP